MIMDQQRFGHLDDQALRIDAVSSIARDTASIIIFGSRNWTAETFTATEP